MNYIECIQKAIDFIEENLCEKITTSDVSKAAFISHFHFYRIFTAIIGIPVKEYIRRRRLSEAANEILTTNKKIIEIAIEYMFESQESFTRSFKKYFDITPGKLRKFGEKLYPYKKADLFLAMDIRNKKGVIFVEMKEMKREKIKLIGIKKRVRREFTHEEIPPMWEEFFKRYGEIKSTVNDYSCYEVCSDSDRESVSFLNFVGVEVSSFDIVPEGFDTMTLPENKYLVFTHKGKVIEDNKSNMHATYDYIYGKFLPESEYEIADDYEFEYCEKERFKGPEHPESEIDIYVPVK